jgi:PKD domain/Galactose oxidase, central domain
MRKLLLLIVTFAVFNSCQKELSCENCAGSNKPPIAEAGTDLAITLPKDSVLLDGGTSTDPDGTITFYKWAKIGGPVSANINKPDSSKTIIKNLVMGVYQFELTVTDNGGLSAKDRVQVTVDASIQCDNNRPQINAQLIPVGNLSQARTGMTVASVGNKILFAGPGSGVDIFDIGANTWSIAQLSSGRGWMGAVAAGNKVFFAGGQDDNGSSLPAVDIYDASTNTWSVSQLSRGADGLAAATVGNKVFFAGGNWGIYAVAIVDIYDLTTNTWSVASLSASRNFITPVSANSKVYFTGGDPWTGQTSNVIDVYDNSTGLWSTSTLQVPRGYHAAIAVNDVLYFAGGKSSYNSPSNCSVETLNVNTGARSLMNLFSPASWSIDDGQNAVVKDNKIIFLRHDGTAKFDIYDIQTNTWSVGIMPMSISVASIISVNNTIYVAGGYVNALSDKVWKLEF